ncbi:hypothetical protein Terro_0807 [Terriglobus roseus DSM 18391]|uniref:DUF4188 domain-containing protein n=1 Tax=Terriglobus roseus (strain DSM 18391 / NRRL B-41598 / KBS 63) TaxID=926566 RepID=I3ZD21_TERRK|nr:DUF4188 domain-containing protein [Terriglobus roseus]AFL87139.1 hypothetical protein Terro_0807 [Terriglobus roseus DSM 18391]
MAKIEAGRFAGTMEGEFVVFVIGMRINNLLAVNKWLPVSRAMPRMLQELFRQPELGLLHAELFMNLADRNVMTLQYWRSYYQLHAYAHARDKEHLPAWAAFNKAARGNTAVGVYHESYLQKPGSYETVYVNMPQFGLAKAGAMVPAVGSMKDAAERLRASGVAPGGS